MYWEKEKEVVGVEDEEEEEEDEARRRAEREPSTRSNAAWEHTECYVNTLV